MAYRYSYECTSYAEILKEDIDLILHDFADIPHGNPSDSHLHGGLSRDTFALWYLSAHDMLGFLRDIVGFLRDMAGLLHDMAGLFHDMVGLLHDMVGFLHDMADFLHDMADFLHDNHGMWALDIPYTGPHRNVCHGLHYDYTAHNCYGLDDPGSHLCREQTGDF